MDRWITRVISTSAGIMKWGKIDPSHSLKRAWRPIIFIVFFFERVLGREHSGKVWKNLSVTFINSEESPYVIVTELTMKFIYSMIHPSSLFTFGEFWNLSSTPSYTRKIYLKQCLPFWMSEKIAQLVIREIIFIF